MMIGTKLLTGVTIGALVIIGFLYFAWQRADAKFETERAQKLEAQAAASRYVTEIKTLATSVTEAKARLEQQRIEDLARVEQLQSELNDVRQAEEEANQRAEELERIEREAGNIQTFDSRGIH